MEQNCTCRYFCPSFMLYWFGSITKVLLQVLEEDDVLAAGPAVNMDMSMLTSTSGYERTHAEFAMLAAGAGLQLDKIDTPAPGQPSLIYISKP